MSFTARERNNPPPRKKSCAACIKAKRRCDFAVPACLRCSQRRIQCEYPSRTPRTKVRAPSHAANGPVPLQDVAVLDGALSDDCSGGAETIAGQLRPTATGELEEPVQYSFKPIPYNFETLGYVTEIQDHDVIHQPSMLAAPTTKGFHDRLAEIVANRLQFSLDQIHKAPKTMVMETQTPWSHPLLYADSMPRSMQGKRISLYPLVRSNVAHKMRNRRPCFLCTLCGKESSKCTRHFPLHRVSSAGFAARAHTNNANRQPRSHPGPAPLRNYPTF